MLVDRVSIMITEPSESPSVNYLDELAAQFLAGPDPLAFEPDFSLGDAAFAQSLELRAEDIRSGGLSQVSRKKLGDGPQHACASILVTIIGSPTSLRCQAKTSIQ